MTTTLRRLLPALFAVAFGCANQDSALTKLSTALDEVRRTEAVDVPVERRPEVEGSVLVGLTRAALVAKLGEPEACAGWSPGSAAYPVHERATKCELYRFYKLPPRWNGGGSSLVLLTDTSGTVVASDWMGEE